MGYNPSYLESNSAKPLLFFKVRNSYSKLENQFDIYCNPQFFLAFNIQITITSTYEFDLNCEAYGNDNRSASNTSVVNRIISA